MADKKMYKVGITVKEPWSADISYEVLDVTLYAVESGGDGCSYTAIKPNQGVTPGTDSTVWVKSTQAGQSIYDLAVKYHHFVGTEEEFEQQYQDALAAANNAASAASATDEQIQANELARVSAENSRVTAERARSDAETARSSAETARINAENARNNAESLRDTAESDRVRAEAGRVTAEASRVEAETFRQGAEQSRRQQFEGLKTDMETAIDNVDAKAAEIEEDIEGYEANEAARVSAEQSRVSAESSRVSAESARATAETARETQASSDHTRAETDHGTAASDHTTATGDHTQAGTDHTQAASDHTTAAADHTRAEADHTASETATQAATDAAEAATEAAETIDEKIAGKADKDGYYGGMTVGAAENLAGKDVQTGEFATAVMSGADGLAKINEVMGKSLVWNQLVQNGNFADTSDWTVAAGVSMSVADGVCTLTANASIASSSRIEQEVPIIASHKYLFSATIDPSVSSYISFRTDGNDVFVSGSVSAGAARKSNIITAASAGTKLRLYINSNSQMVSGDTFKISNVICIDLTLMFGAGNEPTTVEEFEALYPLPYYDYNPGEIISNNTEALEITGLNQWDEEWEVGGINSSTGNGDSSYTDYFRSKNYVPCSGSTDYYIKRPLDSGHLNGYLFFYDFEGKYLGISTRVPVYNTTGKSFTTPANAKYLKFSIQYPSYTVGTICINLSDPSRNGEYEPYQKSEFALNLATIAGKLNGEGESVTIFPDGMRSAGTAFDSLIVDEDGWCRKAIKRVGVVDAGTLSWNASGSRWNVNIGSTANAMASSNIKCAKYATVPNTASTWDNVNEGQIGAFSIYARIKDTSYSDAADFKTAMAGVPLIYELATPLEYVLDTPIQMTFQAKHGGVIRQLPENGSEPTTAPMRMSVTYALDAVSILSDLPENYVSKESLQAMLSAMQSAGLFSAYTMTFNESTGKYEFTFTANA